MGGLVIKGPNGSAAVTLQQSTNVTKVVEASDIASDAFVKGRVGTGGAFNFRNKIIDGRFDFWYEGTSQTTKGYGSDTMWSNDNVGSTKVHSQQLLKAGVDLPAIEVPTATYFSRTVVTSVAGASNYVLKLHRIENVKTLAGKTATVSFYAKADTNRNISVDLHQYFGSGGSNEITTGGQWASLTTTWKRYAITFNIPSVSGKTISGIDALSLRFWFDASINNSGNINSLTQQSGTFDLACIQLEEGSVATPFEELPIEISKHRVNRYFEQLTFPCILDTNTTNINSSIQWSTTKRHVPTCSVSNIGGQNNVGSYSVLNIYTDGCRFGVIPSVSTNDTYMFGITLNVDARL